MTSDLLHSVITDVAGAPILLGEKTGPTIKMYKTFSN